MPNYPGPRNVFLTDIELTPADIGVDGPHGEPNPLTVRSEFDANSYTLTIRIYRTGVVDTLIAERVVFTAAQAPAETIDEATAKKTLVDGFRPLGHYATNPNFPANVPTMEERHDIADPAWFARSPE